MSAPVLRPRDARVFHFLGSAFAPAAGEVRLRYRVDDGPVLVERISFPDARRPASGAARAAFGMAVQLLHWIAGVSYWKAGLAPEIRFKGARPPAPIQRFLTRLYIDGLAEFSYVNGVDVATRLNMPAGTAEGSQPREAELPERALVAMGGGKDSIVGLELARQAGLDVRPWCVGDSALIGSTVDAAGLGLLRIRRQLAPELNALNGAGAYNGHVPVTAINSAIGVCAALLYGYRYVIFANERSADEATRSGPDGTPINHQYSKSSAFESAFRAVINDWVATDLEYFSILRPWSELEIVRRFSEMTRYHAFYSSCNRNFHLAGPAISGRWCGNCPKCRFAVLSLGVFMTPAQVFDIIGADLLDDSTQERGFRELCGFGADKPFECVGETGESRAALQALAQRPGWRDKSVVRRLAPELAGLAAPKLDDLLQPSPHHFIPARIAVRLQLPLR